MPRPVIEVPVPALGLEQEPRQLAPGQNDLGDRHYHLYPVHRQVKR